MGFSLLSIPPHVVIISCLKWSQKSSFNQTKHISLCCIPPCLVTRQMFWSSSLTKHRGLFYAFLNISHLFYTFPRCKRFTNVRSSLWVLFFWSDILTSWDWISVLSSLNIQICNRSIRSFATAICSAYKWTHPHLVEFQCTELLAMSQEPLLASNFTEV